MRITDLVFFLPYLAIGALGVHAQSLWNNATVALHWGSSHGLPNPRQVGPDIPDKNRGDLFSPTFLLSEFFLYTSAHVVNVSRRAVTTRIFNLKIQHVLSSERFSNTPLQNREELRTMCSTPIIILVAFHHSP